MAGYSLVGSVELGFETYARVNIARLGNLFAWILTRLLDYVCVDLTIIFDF